MSHWALGTEAPGAIEPLELLLPEPLGSRNCCSWGHCMRLRKNLGDVLADFSAAPNAPIAELLEVLRICPLFLVNINNIELAFMDFDSMMENGAIRVHQNLDVCNNNNILVRECHTSVGKRNYCTLPTILFVCLSSQRSPIRR